jgi:hypothetical protein
VKEILTYVIKEHSFSKAKKLGYLNVFVKLINKCGGTANLGFPLRSILIWYEFMCISLDIRNVKIIITIDLRLTNAKFLFMSKVWKKTLGLT